MASGGKVKVVAQVPVAAARAKNELTWQEILVTENYLSSGSIARIESEANAVHADPLDVMFSLGLITKDLFGQAIAEHYGVPYADLNSHPPTKEDVLKIPEGLARKERRIFFGENKGVVTIATDRPNQLPSNEFRTVFSGKKLQPAYSLPEDIERMFSKYQKTLDTRFAKIIAEKGKVAPEVIDEIMADAITFRASDIHFEPQEKDTLIRFRIDGILREAGRLSKDLYANVLNRLKVQAHLRTDEHFSAQDGAIRYSVKNQTIDVRVSIVPILDGEKIVLRLLSEYMRRFQLSDLGLSQAYQQQLLEAAEKPFGMILVVGPTGSGKTTTLYAAVKSMNHTDVNIATIEDPVEYKISGINHIQVNTQTNLTFAKGLRSIVRQDPDVILVGEIRDQETAEISVNAALTGHLLLSTFHANDAAAAIPRLLDMGAEPFLLSSTIELIIAQRLARKICQSCRYSAEMPYEEFLVRFPGLAEYFSSTSVTLYQGKGCPACSMTGYSGRIGLFELIHATPELRDLIMHKPSAGDVLASAQASGTRAMFLDGLDKVMNGVTSLDELLRVVAPPEKKVV